MARSSPKSACRKRKSSVSTHNYKRRKISEEKHKKSPKKEVIKSPLDKSQYKLVILPNGIKCILNSTLESPKKESKSDSSVVDECTGELKSIVQFNKKYIQFKPENSTQKRTKYKDKSSYHKSRSFSTKSGDKKIKSALDLTKKQLGGFSLSVGVGSRDDPQDFQGMAHLCEHCVLLETKGSGRGIYDPWLRHVYLNDGYGNATTEFDKTTYFFQSPLTNSNGNRIFEESVKLLADAIAEPLLCKESIIREINALDCEYEIARNRMHVTTKLMFLIFSLAKTDHPLNWLSFGNQETLGKPCITETLRGWKEKHYVGDSMTLSIQAPLKLTKLEKIVVQNFSRIPKSSKSGNSVKSKVGKNEDPLDTPEFRKIYMVNSLSTSLFISWSLPAHSSKEFQSGAVAYISYIFNYKNKGSLSHYLRRKQWATGSYAGAWNLVCCTLFTIDIVLTESGVDNYENVIESVFSYLNFMKLRKTDVRILNELQQMCADDFHGRPTTDFVYLSGLIQNGRGIYALTDDRLITRCEPKYVDTLMEKLTPRSANFMLLSNRFEGNPNEVQEKWFGIKYVPNDLTEDNLSKWTNVRPYLEYQIRQVSTDYLIRDFQLKCPENTPTTTTSVRTIVNDSRVEVTHTINPCKPGEIVRAYCEMSIYSNLSETSLNTNLAHIWMRIMRAEAESWSWSEFSDSSIYIKSPSLIRISIECHSSQLLELVQRTLERFCSFGAELKEEKYDIYRDMSLKDMEDNANSTSFIFQDVMQFILDHNYNDRVDRDYSTLKDTNFMDLIDFIRTFKAQMKIECEISGSVTNNQADEIAKCITDMSYRKIPGGLPLELQPKCMQIHLGQKCVRLVAPNPEATISIVRNYYQIGPCSSLEQYTMIENLCNILAFSCFDQLRTVEQLSYHVKIFPNSYNGILGISIQLLVQTHKYTVEKIDMRIDEFLKTFYETDLSLENLTQTVKKYPNLGCRCQIYLEKMRALFADHLLPDGKGFRKLSLQIVADPNAQSHREAKPGHSLQYDLSPLVTSNPEYYITNIDLFKSRLYAYPSARSENTNE